MFVFKAATVLLAAVTLAVSRPSPGGGSDGGECNTGSQQCCESVQVRFEQSFFI